MFQQLMFFLICSLDSYHPKEQCGGEQQSTLLMVLAGLVQILTYSSKSMEYLCKSTETSTTVRMLNYLRTKKVNGSKLEVLSSTASNLRPGNRIVKPQERETMKSENMQRLSKHTHLTRSWCALATRLINTYQRQQVLLKKSVEQLKTSELCALISTGFSKRKEWTTLSGSWTTHGISGTIQTLLLISGLMLITSPGFSGICSNLELNLQVSVIVLEDSRISTRIWLTEKTKCLAGRISHGV